MTLKRIIRMVSLVIGGLFLAIACWGAASQLILIAGAATATGEVIELRPAPKSEGSSQVQYRPVVRFVTDSGATTIVGQVASSPPAYAVGDAVRVYYDPARPAEALIDSYVERWLMPVGFGVMGIAGMLTRGLLSGGSLWAVLARRRLRRQLEDLRQRGQRVRAKVVDVRQDPGRTVNGRHPWRVLCEWKNPLTQETRRFTSEPLGFDPRPQLAQGHIDVLVDTADASRYWVDTEFRGATVAPR
jgi:hypothetical protein